MSARSKKSVSVAPGSRHVTVTPVSFSSARSAKEYESKYPFEQRSRLLHWLGRFIGMRRVGCALIDATRRQARKLLVGCLFLVQRLLQKLRGLGVARRLCPGDQRSIRGHLVVVLGALPGRDQARIHRGVIEVLFHSLSARRRHTHHNYNRYAARPDSAVAGAREQ
jgi:hypothetical protein